MKKPNSRLLSLIYQHRYMLGIITLGLLAVIFRILNLNNLPPGLHVDEASYGVKALNVLRKTGALPLGDAQALSQPFLYLQALSVNLFGNSTLALRIVPAFFGILGVGLSWLLAKQWFGTRIAFIVGLIVAVTPWSVTFSRTGTEASLAISATCLILLSSIFALRKDNLAWSVLAGITTAVSIWAYPTIWTLVIGVIVAAGFTYFKSGDQKQAYLIRAAVILGACLLVLALIIGIDKKHDLGKTIIHQAATLKPSSSVAESASRTLLMFNYQGDNDFRNNAAGLPQLNLFIGLMFLLGILICALHFRGARHTTLLLLLAFGILPGLGSTNSPDSRLTLAVLPIVALLAAVGIDYMIEAWYRTFPINSAARVLGTLPIIILLILSTYQAYQQYFVAWAHSPETFEAYNERATAIAGFMNRNSFEGDRYGVLDDYDNLVVGYLSYGRASYNRLGINDASVLPKDDHPKQFIITRGLSDNYLKALKQAYPKAKLSQHYSEYNDNNELFAVYEVTK